MAVATTQQLYALSQQGAFLDRTAGAIAKYQSYLVTADAAAISSIGVGPYRKLLMWAINTLRVPRQVALEISPQLVLDAAFTSLNPPADESASVVNDATFQAAVESTINRAVRLQ